MDTSIGSLELDRRQETGDRLTRALLPFSLMDDALLLAEELKSQDSSVHFNVDCNRLADGPKSSAGRRNWKIAIGHAWGSLDLRTKQDVQRNDNQSLLISMVLWGEWGVGRVCNYHYERSP